MSYKNRSTHIDVYFTLLLFMILTCSAKGKDRFEKKSYIAGMRSSYPKDSTFKLDSSFHKYNRTSITYTVNVTITDFIDSRYDFKFELRVWSDGGWKRNKVNYEGNDPCKQLSFILGKSFMDILRTIGHKQHCPLEPGVYQLKDFTGSRYNVPFDVFLGKQMSVYDVIKDGRVILHVEYENEVHEYISVF